MSIVVISSRPPCLFAIKQPSITGRKTHAWRSTCFARYSPTDVEMGPGVRSPYQEHAPDHDIEVHPKLLVALGGNALLRRGDETSLPTQIRRAREAAAILKALAMEGFDLCITHGNGPQIGQLALQAPDTPLDVLGAECEGQIGYLLERELAAELPDKEVVSILTQVVVDENDSAFRRHPTKFIGPTYDVATAEQMRKKYGFQMASQDGNGYRRVVASPQPIKIVEAAAIKVLLKAGIIPICAGGGGIPVALSLMPDGTCWRRHGIEAVIDKDAASSLLAAQTGADQLLLLTDEPEVCDPTLWPAKRITIRSPITPNEIFQLGDFASGSMAPKVHAACSFVRKTGKCAAIGAVEDAVDVAKGLKGTTIVPDL